MAIAGHMPVEDGDGGLHGPGQVNNLVDLYRQHQQRIYRYCLALLRNPDDAEDATQETFTRAAPFLPKLPGDLSAYLTTVARNICCDVVRARSRRSVPIEGLPLADRKVSPERESVDWDVVRRMWRQLTPSERLLFAYTFAGYKYEEIASRTGMSRPSVSVGLARARRRLRDLAAATGTLALLPVAIKRLLERAARRVNSAAASAQATVVGVVDQVGVVAVALLSGLFAITATSPAVTASMAATALRDAPAAPATVAQQVAAATAPSAGASTLTARRPHPAVPPPASPLPPAASPAAAILPGAGANPFDNGADFVTASPTFASDHIVFATGSTGGTGGNGLVGSGGQNAACAVGDCPPALYRSSDAGASWTRLAYGTFLGGRVLLPPDFPADPAFFVIRYNTALEESPTGDGNFTWQVPGAVDAAIAPWSTAADTEIAVLVGNAVQVWRAGATAPSPGPMLPSGLTPSEVRFTDAATVLVSGTMDVNGTLVGATAACPIIGTCGAPIPLPGDPVSTPTLAVSPDVATDHLVVAEVADGLDVSRDGGRQFTRAAKPPLGTFTDVTVGIGPLGPRIVGSSLDYRSTRVGVLYSDDMGQTFVNATGNIDGVSKTVGLGAYPDGTILAALSGDATNHFGLRVSSGDGRWINPA